MNGTTNFMINKSKSFTSGERRSFVIRIRTYLNQASEYGNKNEQDSNNNINHNLNKKSGMFLFNYAEYKELIKNY